MKKLKYSIPFKALIIIIAITIQQCKTKNSFESDLKKEGYEIIEESNEFILLEPIYSIGSCVILLNQEYEVTNSKTVRLPATGIAKVIYQLKHKSENNFKIASEERIKPCN